MGDNFQFFDIILFGMIAAFLVLRLRSVLGRRKDDEPEGKNDERFTTEAHENDNENDNIVSLPSSEERKVEQDQKVLDPEDKLLIEVVNHIPNFDKIEFLVGARTAFEMIVEGFAAGDRELLGNLLNKEVYGNFEQSIADREKDSLILENTLIRIIDCQIIEGSVDGSDVFIMVKIISEQINVTRNNEGDTVDGDPEHITTITDIWTFSRNTNDKDPNWELVATRSVE
jgi:predicted lipid-binding transport protein (Tim44 family)